jgi:site-specific recombinase XerD
MCHKKSSDLYSIPFDIPFTYTPLEIDQVPQIMQVQPTNSTRQANVETIEDAIELYLEMYGKQFTGQYGIRNKRLFLQRFVTFLKSQGYSMKLADLTLEDGQRFLNSIEHAYHGGQMSPQTKKGYKSALRSFSLFLHTSKVLSTDIFFSVATR